MCDTVGISGLHSSLCPHATRRPLQRKRKSSKTSRTFKALVSRTRTSLSLILCPSEKVFDAEGNLRGWFGADYTLVDAYLKAFWKKVHDNLASRFQVFLFWRNWWWYFHKFPWSNDVTTRAFVQEGTSPSGVSFPPPTHLIAAPPAGRLLCCAWPRSRSLLSESPCPVCCVKP